MSRSAAFRIGLMGLGVLAVLASPGHVTAQQQLAQPGYGPGYGQQAPPPPMSGRQMFAATLGAVVQAGAPVAVSALAGALTSWLSRKATGTKPGTFRPGDGQIQTPGSVPSDPGAPPPEDDALPDVGGGSDWQDVGTETWPDEGGDFPSTTDSTGGYQNTPDCYRDTHSGSSTEVFEGPRAPCPRRDLPPVYAGVAYEIHAVTRGGSMRVDPATHLFRTGERFVVHYRPTLPGRVDVHNINAVGQHAQIDSVNVAGGELASLGPYEFAASKGNETLILQLSPCASAPLLQETYAVTRDIVKAGDYGSAMQLSDCSGTVKRGLTKTRDIRKVSVEDGTSFALDQISSSELASGDVTPRQVTITLLHR